MSLKQDFSYFLMLSQETIPPNSDFNKLFLDLLRRIFVYDPAKRITAHEALLHPWFLEVMRDDGTEARRIQSEKVSRYEERKKQEELRLQERSRR